MSLYIFFKVILIIALFDLTTQFSLAQLVGGLTIHLIYNETLFEHLMLEGSNSGGDKMY